MKNTNKKKKKKDTFYFLDLLVENNLDDTNTLLHNIMPTKWRHINRNLHMYFISLTYNVIIGS